ncbi:MAG: type II toxin-antitoxin system prevent-host-death family antitoxin [Thermoanaerobacteraceae bacterium]|nr:type II toxin-antitoxin system prevent-host-death family antitoxin [Thermoanaerobacteraceae bacterium]
MMTMTMTVSQGKTKFLELIRRAENNNGTLIEKKGIPVAAVLPYKEYVNLKRTQSYLAMMRFRQIAKDAGLTAQEIYEESRRELEARGSRE